MNSHASRIARPGPLSDAAAMGFDIATACALEDGHLELYNLRDDIGETINFAMKMPEKAKELRGKMLAWRTEIQAPMPAPNSGGEPREEKKSNNNRQEVNE